MNVLTGWRYLWRRYLGWVPLQFCVVCGSPYWGGIPWRGWQPCYMDYCSRMCCDQEMEMFDQTSAKPVEQPEPKWSTTIHVGISIRGALRSGEYRNFVKSCTDKTTGRPLTELEVFDCLCDELAQGHEIIPFDNACDNWDPKTGCKGHRHVEGSRPA
jgi:hypothetical protein